MDMRSINHQVRVNEWRETIAECRRSGKSVKEWCSENSIKTAKYYWLRVIRNESLALEHKSNNLQRLQSRKISHFKLTVTIPVQ